MIRRPDHRGSWLSTDGEPGPGTIRSPDRPASGGEAEEAVRGLLDQAEAVVAALRAKGVPHAYLLFAGEQHGFRKAENIRAALDGELSFYAQVWGFGLPAAEGIEPLMIR